ncbi:MAG: PHP domain-containing protein [Bacteroidetes bacterium]|nr:PHP domain-containing protein [Bacteroidota bacterium]
MNYRADIHIHSVLSPCSNLDMSPVNIINIAKERKLHIIGLTDHNSTKQCRITREIGEKNGIFVLCGAEITTKEEVHCLTFFENDKKLFAFQEFIEAHLPDIKNDVQKFGYQLVVDEKENIIGEEEILLQSALNISIDSLADKVHELNGLFIPAHVNRQKFSLISQLGFIPKDIKADALEISRHISKEEFLNQFPYLKTFPIIQSSDAHCLESIGETTSVFEMDEISYTEICKAFANVDGRKVFVNK